MLSHVQLFVTPWTVARQAPLPVGFPRQEQWSGLPFLPPWDPPDPGIKLQADSLPLSHQGSHMYSLTCYISARHFTLHQPSMEIVRSDFFLGIHFLIQAPMS